METILNQIPKMLSGNELKEAMTYLPDYEVSIRNADTATRLLSLSDVYQIYIPTNMSTEIYSKLYLAMVRSLHKKNSIESTIQLTENYKAMHGAPYVGINGGDSFTIIGTSGLGKTSSIERSLSLIDSNRLINLETPSFQSKVIKILRVQCPHDCSCRGMLLEILRQADMILGSCYYERAVKAKATVDMLIGTVCQLAVKSIAVIIVDEIQNLVEHKGGQKLMAMLTQLINCGNVSTCMVGMPDCIPFFESDLRLARRSTGLIYESLPYNQNFIELCKSIYQYQYVKNPTELTEGTILWLYEHSAGIISNVISLFHDAQEIAILNQSETLNIEVLNATFTQRMSMMNSYIAPFVRKNSQTSRVSKKKIVELPKVQDETVIEVQDVYKLIMEARRTDNNVIHVLKEAGYIMEVAI